MNSPKKHVAVLPFPFTSHPSLLAKLVLRLAIAAPKLHFSFLNTAKSNVVIFPPHSKHDLPSNIKIYDIDAPQLPGGGNLLEEVEMFFKTACGRYGPVLDIAVAEIGVPVSCLVTDVMISYACEIASTMRVDWIAMWVAAPYTLLAHIYTNAIVDHLRLHGVEIKKKIDFVPGLSMMHLADLPGEILQCYNRKMNAISRALAEVDRVLPNASAVVINSFVEETLTEATSVLRSKFQTLLQVGCPTEMSLTQSRSDYSDQTEWLSWLNQRNPKSVVYVGFGTFSMMPPEEISAIAEALEEKKNPYIWSLKDHLKIHLPPEFIERTSSYGKVLPWAPQTLVLTHASVGAHLTHAGYNSMVESIVGEVPMICRPLWADNMMNARMVEEVWRIGVGVDGRIITKNGLVKCLEKVLGDGDEGKRMREKIKALKEVMVEAAAPNGSATKDFNSLVEMISK